MTENVVVSENFTDQSLARLGEKLFQKRYEHAKNVKSPPFTMKELETTLKSLTTGKSRDPEFLKCDIFKENVIGDDLKLSILMMINKMKDKTYIPACFKVASITMLYKKKNKLDLTNWRGIFVTSVLRTILMKMVHNRTYEIVA